MKERKLVEIKEGRKVYEYADGSKRYSDGTLAYQPAYAAPTITKETASELANRRWDMVRENAVIGAMKGSGTTSEPSAIQRITEIRTQVAVDKDAGHAGNEATKLVARMAGWLRPQDTGPAVVQNIVALPADLIDRLTK